MKKLIQSSVILGTLIVFLGATMMSSAQQRSARQRGQRSDANIAQAQQRGMRGGGQWDPEQMRQRMAQRMKESLGATDEEWQVISPLLQDVMEKQREVRSFSGRGMMMMRGPRGPEGDRGRRGRGFGREDTPAEVTALQEALESDSTPVEEIKSKLDAYRKARQAQEKELEQAQDKLRQILSVRQEATLVMMGMLD